MRKAARAAAVLGVTLAAVTVPPRTARADANPHLSEEWLPSSNGRAAIAWDRTQFKLVQFLEHPYTSLIEGTSTRNFLYDSYPGLRIGTTGTWFSTVAPLVAEYLPGTGIVHSMRMISGYQIDEYDFAPQGLASYASFMIVKVTATSTATPGSLDAYSIFNYQLGTGSPTPGNDSELITYDSTRDTYYESGPSGVTIAYRSLVASTHHGCTPNNPFGLLNSGSNLMDDPGNGAPTTNSVAGFQSSIGTLTSGQSATVGWFTVLAPDSNGSGAVDAVDTWVAGRAPDKILSDEIAGWASWIKPAPKGASAEEAAIAAQAQVMLRMGQVTETGTGNGQILASVAPGMWNIAWVRDMAYATVGLLRSGHTAEAKAAIAFQMGASVGTYQQQVGGPYLISVVRYYGDGSEWSDTNNDGPNIEFDGFGLFLWELEEYVKATGDTASLKTWWPTVKSKVGDILVNLQEPTGLIAADSSIWEVHWNGQQKHFAYTTITAANGLCAASRLATTAGDSTTSAKYLTAGQTARDAFVSLVRAPDGTLAQSTEALASGSGWLDAAVVEAINFGLIDPAGRTAAATLATLESGLVPQSGRGFMRSNVGDDYSSHEWVFVDLRAARALEVAKQTTYAANLFAWNVAQASDNFGELSELHDPVTGDYAGQCPMVGFGAGAYLIRLFDRGTAATPTCVSYAVEPPPAPVTTGNGGSTVGGAGGAGGSNYFEQSSGSGAGGGATSSSFLSKACSCGIVGLASPEAWGTPKGGSKNPSGPTDFSRLALLAMAPLALVVRRRRRA